MVGPGRRADLVVLGDLEQVAVDDVFTDGRHVAHAGELLVEVAGPPAGALRDTVKVGTFAPDDFVIRLTTADGAPLDGVATVRTIVNPIFTSWGEAEVRVRAGAVEVPDDLLVHAAVHRFGRAPAVPAFGLLAGWGTWTGAIATTLSHDTHNLQVFGRDAADMALAANTVVATGGGVAVVRGGELLASIALPVAGILSDRPVHEVVAAQHAISEAAAAVGEFLPILSPPIFQCMASSLACLPGPHVTDAGIADGTTGELVRSLLVDAPA